MALCFTFTVASRIAVTSEKDKTEGNFFEFLTRGISCMLKGRFRTWVEKVVLKNRRC